jgi:hypothetical protein
LIMPNNISRRRRPCVNCGGRYFERTVRGLAAFVGLLGFAAIPAAVYLQNVPLGVGAFAVFGLVAIAGASYRCIACDTRQ